MSERASAGTDDLRLRDMVGRLQETRTRRLSAAATLTNGDDVVLVDTTGGSVTVTLPPAARSPGKWYWIKKMTAANTLTVQRAGSDTIDGATTLAWTTQYKVYALASVETAVGTWNWVVLGVGP